MRLENEKTPLFYILIGFVLVVIGAVMPFLMVMQIVRSTIFLNFISYAASISGLLLGILGAALYVRNAKDRKK